MLFFNRFLLRFSEQSALGRFPKAASGFGGGGSEMPFSFAGLSVSGLGALRLPFNLLSGFFNLLLDFQNFQKFGFSRFGFVFLGFVD